MRPSYAAAYKGVALEREDALSLLESMLNYNLFSAVSMTEKGEITLEPSKVFDIENFYTFTGYKASNLRERLIGIGILAVILLGVLFPLWPPSLRQGVYYLSLCALGLLGLLMAIVVVRSILYVATVLTGRGGWLFPNLFADVGILESFQPFWAWSKVKKVKAKEKKSE